MPTYSQETAAQEPAVPNEGLVIGGELVSNGNPVPVSIQSGSSAGTQYTDGGTPPANPIGDALVFDNAGAWTDVGIDHPLPTQAPANAIADLLTLLTLAGTPTDANTVASFMGRLTKIRDALLGTLTVSGAVTTSGTVTEASAASILTALNTLVNDNADLLADGDHLATIDTSTAASKTDLDTINTNIATIVPGVQGWIGATGTGTAGQEDVLTFANQVRRVMLYNASANAIPLEFDQTVTATSFPLQPGASWIIDDILCTTVHVWPAATLPINTTSGLYIKGWK